MANPITYDLEREFIGAQTIARRLEGDFYVRIGACVLTAAIIAWSGLITIAGVWIFFVFLNEAIEPSVVRQLLRSRHASRRKLMLYAIHLSSGSTIWAGAGIALWMTSDPAVMTLGAVLLLGTLVHVTLIYSVSKLLVLFVSAPLVLAMGFLALLVLADDGIAARDKTLVIFSVLVLLGYLVQLLLTNIKTQEAMTNLSQENARLARQDTLTELSNRRHFVETIQERQNTEQPFAIAFIDLDRFKPLNDEHGHAIGDEALKVIAERLKDSQAIDFAARLGGDEFGALVCSPDKFAKLKASMNELWENLTRSIDTSIGSISLGASIGCAMTEPSLSDHSKLMHAADVAMIRAKSNGGGVAVFDALIDAGMFEAAEVESAFRSAVFSGEIRGALQPIKCVRSQTIKKFELLARWERLDGGKSLSPNEFIPLAERLGLLNHILWRTLDEALPKIRGTRRTLAINISPSQLLSAQFFEKLEAKLRAHIVPPSQIELEITEQIALRNDKENLAHLQMASDVGFSIVLDDFGTGYSSISLLDELPINKVKLDHAFVRGAMETDHGQKLLSAIVGLLKQMDLRCCIEGVESVEIEDFVTALDCEEVQGYHIGRPKIIRAADPQPMQLANSAVG